MAFPIIGQRLVLIFKQPRGEWSGYLSAYSLPLSFIQEHLQTAEEPKAII